MQYRAFLSVDFTQQNGPEWQRLVAALLQEGWLYSETTALYIDTTDLKKIWHGVELVARQSSSAGTLSSLTFFVQGAADFTTGKAYVAAKNYPNALADIRLKPLP